MAETMSTPDSNLGVAGSDPSTNKPSAAATRARILVFADMTFRFGALPTFCLLL